MRNAHTLCNGLNIVLNLALICFLCSCVPAMTPYASRPYDGGAQPQAARTLPKIDITPPAKFTRGAPEYTMQFHTFASNAYAKRMAQLHMISHPGPEGGASPKAYHMIPANMNMGDYLPLLPQERSASQGHINGHTAERMILKYYWGCADTIRKGQPRVHDSGKMGEQGGGSGGYNASADGLKPGWVKTDWPNRDDTREVPNNASLVGEHFVHGNFLPHIRFSMDSRHELMDALSVRAENSSLKDAISITWNKLPTAIGYHVTAMSFNAARKETIIWSSSEKAEPLHVGHFLPTPQVKRYISEKVILPADRDRCVIPKGIFSEGDDVTVTVTAWGEDYWASQPTRPADAPKTWKPDWVVKGQFLSTGHLMLGRNMGGAQATGGQPAQQGYQESGAAAPARPGRGLPFGLPF